MTYRIIEGELYTVVESNSCFARMVPCVFAELDNFNHPCVCMRFIGDSQYLRPCTVPDLPRGNISVYVNERVSNEQLEWPVVVRGQQGQQTVVAIQTSPGSVVEFSSRELA